MRENDARSEDLAYRLSSLSRQKDQKGPTRDTFQTFGKNVPARNSFPTQVESNVITPQNSGFFGKSSAMNTSERPPTQQQISLQGGSRFFPRNQGSSSNRSYNNASNAGGGFFSPKQGQFSQPGNGHNSENQAPRTNGFFGGSSNARPGENSNPNSGQILGPSRLFQNNTAA